MGKIHWYKRDPVAWLHGTRNLSLEERGVYADIIELIMSHDGRLEDDDKHITAWLQCHWRTWRAIKKKLIELEKIAVEDGFIINHRCSIEASESLERIARMEEAGRAGGLASGASRRLMRASRTVQDTPQEWFKMSSEPPQDGFKTDTNRAISVGCGKHIVKQPLNTTTTTTTKKKINPYPYKKSGEPTHPSGPENLTPMWNTMLSEIGSHAFATWLKPLTVKHVNDKLELIAPSKFHRDYVTERYASRMRTILGMPVEVTLVIA